MPGLVGRPSAIDARRPYRPKVRHLAPRAIKIEVFVPDRVGRDVAGGLGLLLAAVAVLCPPVKLVGSGGVHQAIAKLAITRDRGIIASPEWESAIVAGNLSGAGPDDHLGLLTVDVDPVVSGSANGEGDVWCVNFKNLVLIQIADSNVEAAGNQLQLDGLVVEQGESGAGLFAQTDGGGADMEFGMAIDVGPHLVASGERIVDLSGHPVGASRLREHADGASGEIEACDAPGRVSLRDSN